MLYVPEGYNEEPDKKWPLLVHLHGTGGRARADNTLEENLAKLWARTVPRLITNGSTRFDEFIVVTPQSEINDNSNGWWNAGDVNSLVADIAATYSIDTNRLIVSGQSMGGAGTYKTILSQPDKYAAAAPICPATRVGNPDLIDHMPIWINHGDNDPVVSYDKSVTIYNDLAALIGGPNIAINHQRQTERTR